MVAEKIITYNQAIARVQVIYERQHVVMRGIAGFAYPRSNNPICLPSFFRVLTGLGGEPLLLVFVLLLWERRGRVLQHPEFVRTETACVTALA